MARDNLMGPDIPALLKNQTILTWKSEIYDAIGTKLSDLQPCRKVCVTA